MRRHSALFTAALLITPGAVRAQGASFQGLGALPGIGIDVNGVSADGGVVVGDFFHSTAQGRRTFRWTPEGGFELLPVPPGHVHASGNGVSADGSVVVGQAHPELGNARAYRWTAATGPVVLPGPGGTTNALAVSADGLIAVGRHLDSGGDDIDRPVRWAPSFEFLAVPGLPAWATGVSGDGAVVVGRAVVTDNVEAFRWTPGGATLLGHIPGHEDAIPTAASADGGTVVGGDQGAAGAHAFRWTAATGMVALTGTGPTPVEATGVSGDGSVVVGRNASSNTFVWTAEDGARELKAVLEQDYGLDLTGWRLIDNSVVSEDGRTFAGIGFNPQGQLEAWRAVLPGACKEPLALRSWQNPSGGPFELGSNWSGGQVPTSADRVLFDLPDGADYTIGFSQEHTNDQAILRGGNHVRFSLGGQLYALTSEAGCGPGLDIGDAFGSPRLEVENGVLSVLGGARVEGPISTGLVIRSGADLSLDGLNVAPAAGRFGSVQVQAGGELSVSSAAQAVVGGGGTGTLAVEGSGEGVFFGALRIGDLAGGSGDVVTAGSGARLSLFDTSVAGVSGAGSLMASDQAIVDAREVILGRLAGGEGFLIVETGAQVMARDIDVGVDGEGDVRVATLGGLIVSHGVTIPRGTGDGDVRVGSTAGMSAGVIRLRTGGALRVGGLVAAGQLIHNEFGHLNLAGGCLTIQGGPCQTSLRGTGGTLEADTVWIGPGAVLDSATVQLGAGGVLGGTGTLPLDLINAGTINPGDSAGVAGTFTIGGAYAQAPAGALEIELGGTAAGAYDHLSVTGAATLDGTLRFSHIDGFTPAPGDIFDVLSAASVTGAFAGVEGPPGCTYSLAYGPTTVSATVLTVAAEPPAGAPALALHAPAPNPSSGLTALTYETPADGSARLAIIDALGREVALLVDAQRPMGSHKVVLDVTRLAPGPYLIRLQAGGASRITRLTVAR